MVQGVPEVSHTTSWRILRETLLFPYHIHVNDCFKGVIEMFSFYSWYLATDETIFIRNGITNFNNMHVWSFEHPYALNRDHFHHRFSLNVWTSVVDDHLSGWYWIFVIFSTWSAYLVVNITSIRICIKPTRRDTLVSVTWPLRSPDLNPIDLFLWGYFKYEIYRTDI